MLIICRILPVTNKAKSSSACFRRCYSPKHFCYQVSYIKPRLQTNHYKNKNVDSPFTLLETHGNLHLHTCSHTISQLSGTRTMHKSTHIQVTSKVRMKHWNEKKHDLYDPWHGCLCQMGVGLCISETADHLGILHKTTVSNTEWCERQKKTIQGVKDLQAETPRW